MSELSKNKLYILNTPILTNWGIYGFHQITVLDAKRIIKQFSNKFISAVGHKATAEFMSKLLEVEIPANRISIKMESGDIAIVFRLLERLPEGVVLTEEQLK